MGEKSFRWLLSRPVEGKICTLEFFNESELPEGYVIARIGSGLFAIIKTGKMNIVMVRFRTISKIKKNKYLLELDNGEKRLLTILLDKVVLSDVFKDVIKVMQGYIFVENSDGKRYFIDD